MRNANDRNYQVQTPIGMMAVYYREAPFFITEIALPLWETDAGPVGPQVLTPTPPSALPPFPPGLVGLGQTVRQLLYYFDGITAQPPWSLFNMDGLTALQQQVLRAVAVVPFGVLKTYRDIAEDVGRPGAWRFVGTTMAKNPFPILIPCHRVVRSNGEIGGFGGGPDLKKRLIAFENEKTSDQNFGC